MDEELERLRRARARGDPRAALAHARALERAGRVDEALAAAACVPEALAGVASRHPRAVLDWLSGLDYRSARRAIEQLVAGGQARHPALVALAAHEHGDRVLRQHALRALQANAGVAVGPDELARLVATGGLTPPARETRVERERRERWRGLVHRLIDRAGPGQAVALLPWLVPLLATREPVLAARTLAIVRRLTDRDAPPFDDRGRPQRGVEDLFTLAEKLTEGDPA